MQVALFPIEATPLRRRLAELPLTVFELAQEAVEDLRESTAGLVYVASFAAMQHPSWPRLRVRLAQANRRFLIASPRLGSADFMAAARDGAADVLLLSDDDDRWLAALREAEAAQRLWLQLYAGVLQDGPQSLSGRSAAIASLRQSIERLGPTDVNVLVLGESGVGKERVARALHEASRRENFVAVNCAAIPKDLLESELFGVEKGAFTGALKSRAGLVEQAAHGTIFLDEIGEMDIAVQPKLLRYLETRRARRVGGNEDYAATARVVSATNRDLPGGIAAGTFRGDLYYRLAEITLTIPPLAQRPEDIPALALRFLQQANERFGKNIEGLDPVLIQRFLDYPWPGNARELKSTIDRLVLLFDGPQLRADWWETPSAMPSAATVSSELGSLPSDPSLPTQSQRRALARRLLKTGQMNLTEIAARVGVHPATLFRWRQKGLG